MWYITNFIISNKMNSDSSDTTNIIKFQIGPVQDFIASARSTRDLWSGSYLLSWLAATGIRELQKMNGVMIFPNPKGQPLLKYSFDPNDEGILTPNLPNIFIARLRDDGEKAAKAIKNAIEGEWLSIAESVWNKRSHFGLSDAMQRRFFAQVERHLSISWQVTPLDDENDVKAYTEAYKINGWHLDAVRQTRDFSGWDSSHGPMEKDSLTGKEEAVFDKPSVGGDWSYLFKHEDHLGAVAIIKRVWHLAYLKEIPPLKTVVEKFDFRSIPAIASRTDTLDEDDDAADETGAGEKYIAVIAFDGDSIGAWVNGDKSPLGMDLQRHHRKFSEDLSEFALEKVRKIVEEPLKDSNQSPIEGRNGLPIPLGQLIYAGGDDVVALLPADAALDVCRKLRNAFCECTKDTPALNEKPDASVGIAIGHIKAPLQALVREAQRAEKHAKNKVGRPAFSVTILKRSGEITQWGCQWNSNGYELYQKIAEQLLGGKLSSTFPYRVCQLLEPYQNNPTPLMQDRKTMQDFDWFNKIAITIIKKEFEFAVSRQSTEELSTSKDKDELAKLLREYLKCLSTLDSGQKALQALTGLCVTVAFTHRIRLKEKFNLANCESNFS